MLNVLEQEFSKAREEGRLEGLSESFAEGFAEGRAEGEDNLLKLFDAVAQAGNDVLEAMKRANDLAERKKLYAEYGIS